MPAAVCCPYQRDPVVVYWPIGFLEAWGTYEFIGLEPMDVTKPYEFKGFGAMDVTKPYKFIGFWA